MNKLAEYRLNGMGAFVMNAMNHRVP